MDQLSILQDLFKPMVLALIAALAYFLRSQYADLKERIDRMASKLECFPDRYVEKVDCDRQISGCERRRLERVEEIQKKIDAVVAVTDDVVTCINKHVDNCEVRRSNR